jgi:hypothetical protein
VRSVVLLRRSFIRLVQESKQICCEFPIRRPKIYHPVYLDNFDHRSVPLGSRLELGRRWRRHVRRWLTTNLARSPRFVFSLATGMPALDTDIPALPPPQPGTRRQQAPLSIALPAGAPQPPNYIIVQHNLCLISLAGRDETLGALIDLLYIHQRLSLL